eukprot:475373_1
MAEKQHDIRNPWFIMDHLIYGYFSRDIQSVVLPNDIAILMCSYFVPYGFGNQNCSYTILSHCVMEYEVLDWFASPAKYIDHGFQSTLFGHTNSVSRLYSFKNKNLLCSSSEKSTIVWNLTDKKYCCQDSEIPASYELQPFISGKINTIIYPHNGSLSDMDIKLNNRDIMVTCSLDGTINLWDILDFKFLCAQKQQFGVKCVRFLHGHGRTRDLFVSIMGNGTVTLWEVSTDNSGALSMNEDDILIKNNCPNCSALIVVHNPDYWKESVTNSNPNSAGITFMMVICINETVHVFTLQDNKFKLKTHKVDDFVGNMDLSPDGSLLAISYQTGKIELLDCVECTVLMSATTHHPISALTFCRNKYWIAFAHARGVSIVNLETKQMVIHFDIDDHVSKYLLCDGTLVQRGKVISFGQGTKDNVNGTCLAFSYEGNKLFVGCDNGIINIYDFCGFISQ